MHEKTLHGKPSLYAYGLMWAFGVLVLLWKFGSALKSMGVIPSLSGMADWALLFYHPEEAAILNYLFCCAIFGGIALVCYFMPERIFDKFLSVMGETPRRPSYPLLFASFALFLLSVVYLNERSAVFISGALVLSPLFYFWRVPKFNAKWVFGALALVLIILISSDPLQLVVRPPRLINEYPEFPSETLVGVQYVPNDVFLSRPQTYADREVVSRFLSDNAIERALQVMGRGQINHVGHILNPINEYSLGKPLSSIFMQYGVGNTLLFKWCMDFFSGRSFAAYYKCYIFYPLYYLLFLIVLAVLLRDTVDVFLGVSALAFMHFSYGYLALLIAPGIIPTIHFFDVLAVLCMYSFFKGRWPAASLFASFVIVALGAFFNQFFGAILGLGWVAALAVYGFENCRSPKRFFFILFPSLFLLPVFVWVGASVGVMSEGMFKTYFSGFFSWAPARVIVAFTFVYFLVSYWFFLLFKHSRSALKYIYVFAFTYCQGLLVYYYWSGLVNHFWVAIPWMSMQFLVAFKVFESERPASPLWRMIQELKPAFVVFSVSLLMVAAYSFYLGRNGKGAVSSYFASHRGFEWKFRNATLISTMPPSPLGGAVDLINRYADSPGIHIISKFDAILPFISGHYSLMPHFELNWFLFNSANFLKTKTAFEASSPKYLFVDSNLNASAGDLMSPFDDVGLMRAEGASRAGREARLKELFDSVAGGYTLVEKGPVLSVYKRKTNLRPRQ